MLTLQNRTCVFAGATGNIGRGAVRALAEGGMHVVMATHNPDSAKEIIESLQNAPGTVEAVSNEGGDAAALKRVAERFGSVDVVISTTGGLDRPVLPEQITKEQLDQKFHHQVSEVYAMLMAAYPYLKKSRAGRVILLSSAGAQNGWRGENIADSISAGAVLSMTYSLARAWLDDGITVNCIARSGMIDDHEPKEPSQYRAAEAVEKIPMGRLGTSKEFGAMVSYLASEEAAFVTGQVLSLSGGIHIGG